MRGERVFCESLSRTDNVTDSLGRNWQYNSRSDSHSKFAVVGVLVDMLAGCELLRQHIAEGKVGFGVNHEMHDFRRGRKKALDLVLTTKGGEFEKTDLKKLVADYGVTLQPDDSRFLDELPPVRICRVSSPLVALEAKACMTEHIKALPRLYDELSSSFQAINGHNNNTIAAAFIAINCSESFVSSGRNRGQADGAAADITTHSQPKAAKRVIEKLMELPRRSFPDEPGFDAIGVTLVRFGNDGTPVSSVSPEAPFDVSPVLRYQQAISRLCAIYSTRFAKV